MIKNLVIIVLSILLYFSNSSKGISKEQNQYCNIETTLIKTIKNDEQIKKFVDSSPKTIQCLQSYVKDRSLSDTERNEPNPLTANRTGYMSYTNTQYDSPNRLRCFISSDGSTYSEIENLKVFSFPQKVDTIKLAFVNYTDADLTLLSYTLMY